MGYNINQLYREKDTMAGCALVLACMKIIAAMSSVKYLKPGNRKILFLFVVSVPSNTRSSL